MKFITFDIEDWFHILDHPETANPSSWNKFESRIDHGVGLILDLMDKHDLKGTFFCLGWIAEKHPHIIKRIDAAGHHIGTHSYYHQLAYEQTEDKYRKDLSDSMQILSDLTGKTIDAYRAPGFSIKESNLWAFDVMAEEGIKYDSSVFPANRAHGGLPQFTTDQPCKVITKKGYEIIELPMNTASFLGQKFVFSGGGYFRLLPKWYLKKLFNSQDYVMTYFHPRDFDAGQPLIPGLSNFRKFKSYTGIENTGNKLSSMIEQNTFNGLRTTDLSLIPVDVVNL
ncbi:polysaccharide deacetylase family protein [Schleiferiaceae bacterium]|nr:polysaccharide deacetylase family protein [Schleiferiaceae bacterium]